jgi:signal transduction histidine kinase
MTCILANQLRGCTIEPMKVLLSLYFFIIAVIQMGLFFGIYHYYRTQNFVRPNLYWMSSLLISVFGLLTFGAGILKIDDIAKPEFNFTIGNTFFYTAAVLQALFCLSLNKPVTKKVAIYFGVSVAMFLGIFEIMRNYGNFEMRTAFMCCLASIFYAWQIFELRVKRRREPSRQLLYLQYASSAELFFALGRLVILIASSLTIRQVEQIPQVLILFTIAQLVMNTLSYIAIGGYWSERIAIASVKSATENQEIKALLLERENLIASLLRANKTAATGALSASIAHELNQPLGASSLNIQFLQKKLASGELSPLLQKEVLDTLLSDNQRAANIIKSLRSIFSDEKSDSNTVDIANVIESVLSIAKPQISSKNIQIQLRLEANLLACASRSEIQQVVLNIINNAIQALLLCKQSTKILTIEGRRVDDEVQVTIADNGNGIPLEVQDQIFELLASTKRDGMGLGLWLCKHIVMRHGGKIWFEPSPNNGAKFIFTLPANPL